MHTQCVKCHMRVHHHHHHHHHQYCIQRSTDSGASRSTAHMKSPALISVSKMIVMYTHVLFVEYPTLIRRILRTEYRRVPVEEVLEERETEMKTRTRQRMNARHAYTREHIRVHHRAHQFHIHLIGMHFHAHIRATHLSPSLSLLSHLSRLSLSLSVCVRLSCSRQNSCPYLTAHRSCTA